jgi:hypothetical protein
MQDAAPFRECRRAPSLNDAARDLTVLRAPGPANRADGFSDVFPTVLSASHCSSRPWILRAVIELNRTTGIPISIPPEQSFYEITVPHSGGRDR